MSMQRVEHFVQNSLGDLGTAVDAVVAVDQDLGLNDRHDATLLADRGIAGKRFGVGLNRNPTRKGVGHVVDGAPFREACALLLVTIKALRQSVQPLGDFVTGCVGQWNLAGIDLDPRHDALVCRQLRYRRPVVGPLTQCFLIKDDATDEFTEPRRCQQHEAIDSSILLRRLDAYRLESLGDRGAAFIGGQYPFALLYQRSYRCLKLALIVHRLSFPARGQV